MALATLTVTAAGITADEIELRRCHKEEIWDPNYPGPTPIARRRARIPIPERMNFEGNVLKPLDEQAVRRGVQRLKKLGVRSVAVMYLFSFVNPDHERAAAAQLPAPLPWTGRRRRGTPASCSTR